MNANAPIDDASLPTWMHIAEAGIEERLHLLLHRLGQPLAEAGGA